MAQKTYSGTHRPMPMISPRIVSHSATFFAVIGRDGAHILVTFDKDVSPSPKRQESPLTGSEKPRFLKGTAFRPYVTT